MRYGGSAAFRVKKENATLICKPPYAIYFKLDIFVWMERVNDPEGFVVKILMGRSCTTWLWPDSNAGGLPCSQFQAALRNGLHVWQRNV